MIREQWLLSVIKKFRKSFRLAGYPLPDKIRVSCSWPSEGALAKKGATHGETWAAKASGDGHFEVFLSPIMQDSVEVAAVLVHELCHCAVGLDAKHGRKFRQCAIAMGLEGKMTATTPSEAFADRLWELVERFGEYPHATLTHSNATPTQTTRMKKVECPFCGCVARMTRKWLEEVGCPTCACGYEMEREDEE